MNNILEDHIPDAIMATLDTNFQTEILNNEISNLAQHLAGINPDDLLYLPTISHLA